jgi:hypothetical protein
MHDDDMTWWHHQDQLMQELEEQERIEACNKAITEFMENYHPKPSALWLYANRRSLSLTQIMKTLDKYEDTEYAE